MSLKRLFMMNWISMLLVIRYQVVVDYSLKYSMTETIRVLIRRLKMLTKRYQILVCRPRRRKDTKHKSYRDYKNIVLLV